MVIAETARTVSRSDVALLLGVKIGLTGRIDRNHIVSVVTLCKTAGSFNDYRRIECDVEIQIACAVDKVVNICVIYVDSTCVFQNFTFVIFREGVEV